MGRNAQLIRQWAILKQIEHNRWTTIMDMAEHHVVSTKTIRRDLAALMEAGFPLYDERYDGKVYWRLDEEYKGLPLASLSLSEIAALYFSKKLVINLAAPPFSSDIESAFKKIESALPEKNIEFLDSLDSMITVRADAPKDLDQHKGTIRTLLDAIGEQSSNRALVLIKIFRGIRPHRDHGIQAIQELDILLGQSTLDLLERRFDIAREWGRSQVDDQLFAEVQGRNFRERQAGERQSLIFLIQTPVHLAVVTFVVEGESGFHQSGEIAANCLG